VCVCLWRVRKQLAARQARDINSLTGSFTVLFAVTAEEEGSINAAVAAADSFLWRDSIKRTRHITAAFEQRGIHG